MFLKKNYAFVNLLGQSINDLKTEFPTKFCPSVDVYAGHAFNTEKGVVNGHHLVCCREEPPNNSWRRASALEAVWVALFIRGYVGCETWTTIRTSSEAFVHVNQHGLSPVVLSIKNQDMVSFKLEYPTVPSISQVPSYWLSNK